MFLFGLNGHIFGDYLKKTLLKKLLLTIIAVFCAIPALGQTTTEGTEFWFGFMQNADQNPETPSSLEVFITSKENTTGEIFIFTDGSTIDFSVSPGQTSRVLINRAPENPYSAAGSDNIQLKAIRITAENNISVYAFNNRQNSADATVVLPVTSLGNNYFGQSYFEEPPNGDQIGAQNSPAQLLIVSPQDGTSVEITPTADVINGNRRGETYTIQLDEGEIYQIQSQGDLTGTLINSFDSQDNQNCLNVAVFGGNQWTRVTGGQNCGVVVGGRNWAGGYAGDHLFEQMFPINSWGQTILATPIELRNNYAYRILASEDNTIISRNGIEDNTPLSAGEYRDYFASEAVLIEANRPISVVQFSTSASCDNRTVGGDGDPWMLILSPIEQRLTEVTFNALRAENIREYFLTLIGNQNSILETRIDGGAIDENDVVNIENSDLAYVSIRLERGRDYTIINPQGVIPYVYAYGGIESFGYSAGASLENLNLSLIGEDEFIGEIAEQACANADIDFKAKFENDQVTNLPFDRFFWDFDDGTTAEGQEVQHVYDTPGVYTVTLLASKGEPSCGNSETFTKEITILEVEAEQIQGPASVCPDVFGVAYRIDGAAFNTYEWEVEGGTIANGQGTDEILVDWGVARPDALIRVTPINGLGCRGEVRTLPVLINKRLEPADPLSSSPTPTEVCFEERNRVRYFTPQTSGSEYEWFVDNGSFTSDADPSSNEVFVDWGDNTSGRIWYREFNPSISDCEGYSDTLNITVYPQIIDTSTITDALCNGDENGTITLSVSGGKGEPYTADWDNGMTGLSISGLAAGAYTAVITDALGCEVNSQTYTVGEPDPLAIDGDPTVLDVRCFEESNGEISITVSGGTAPYQYEWTGDNFNQNTDEPRVTGLLAGTYSVVVTDFNGCSTSLDIVVNEPLLLEADLNTLINDPICPDASDGVAFVDAKGGTPDYQFFWSNDPNTDDQEATDLSEGTYTLIIEDANGCTSTLTIDKTERNPNVFIPNAFSPNGDGVNDEFKAVADCDVTYSIQIFNQWGAIVFSTNDVNEGWDGNFEGEPVPDGKYSYVVFWAAEINGVLIERNIRGSLNIYR